MGEAPKGIELSVIPVKYIKPGVKPFLFRLDTTKQSHLAFCQLNTVYAAALL